jgi:hypothetical protein
MSAKPLGFNHSYSNQMPQSAPSFWVNHKLQIQGTPKGFKPVSGYVGYLGFRAKHQRPIDMAIRPAWLNKALEVPLTQAQIKATYDNMINVRRK